MTLGFKGLIIQRSESCRPTGTAINCYCGVRDKPQRQKRHESSEIKHFSPVHITSAHYQSTTTSAQRWH